MQFARLNLGLFAALAVEFVDEFFDGTKSGALPLIKHGLSATFRSACSPPCR